MATENTVTSEPVANGMTATQSYYNWAPDGKQIHVRLDFDVIDRMSAEVMRGFGSVPKRGAEVGGLLLGTVDKSGKLLVHIHDFVIVPCDYRRGPSYQLTDSDTRAFSDAVAKAHQGGNPELRPVGYFRSHTRDGMALTDEDLQLFSNYFPDPTSVILLVRPFATKVSQAGFFFEENGQIRSDPTYLQFPFRRRELGGGAIGDGARQGEARVGEVIEPEAETQGESTSSRGPIPIRESGPRSAAGPMPVTPPVSEPPLASSTENRQLFGNRDDSPANFSPSFDITASAQREPFGAPPSFGVSTEASQKIKKSWVWLPLSSIFLLLGVLVGFLIAITIKRPNTAVPLSAYALSLAVQQEPDAIHVTWDRAAVPVAIATRGVLHIQEGEFYKAVELKAADLQTGSVIIRNVREGVTLRLEVFLLDRNSLTEVRVVKAVDR
jgi:hypothetical protein